MDRRGFLFKTSNLILVGFALAILTAALPVEPPKTAAELEVQAIARFGAAFNGMFGEDYNQWEVGAMNRSRYEHLYADLFEEMHTPEGKTALTQLIMFLDNSAQVDSVYINYKIPREVIAPLIKARLGQCQLEMLPKASVYSND